MRLDSKVLDALMSVEDVYQSSAELGRLAKAYISKRYDITIHYRNGTIIINLYMLEDNDISHPVTKQFRGSDEESLLFEIVGWLVEAKE